MAYTPGTSARVQRLTSLVATILVALAIAFAFGRVFQGRWSTVVLLGAGIASASIAWAFERRSVALAAIVTVAALVVGLGLAMYHGTTWYGLPTLDTLRAMGHAAAMVGQQAREQVSPVPPGGPLLFASAIALWAAVFSCHSLAFRAGSPVLSLLPPLALVAFADSVLEEAEKPIYGIWFLIAALTVLFADSLRRVHGWGPVWNGPGRRDRLLPTAGFHARRLAAAVVAIAVAAPFVVPGFGSTAVIDLAGFGEGGPTRLSTLVSMGAELRNGQPVPLFRVQTPIASYYRLTALDRFDGARWSSSSSASTPVANGQAFATSPAGATTYEQRFTVLSDWQSLNEVGLSYLPAGYAPVQVDADRSLTWDPQSSSLSLADGLQAGDEFSVTSTFATPSPEDLSAAGTSSAYGPGLTSLPDAVSPEIRDLAEQWTASATNDFERIMAIQDHLTNAAVFNYDTKVNYHEDAASILEFLKVSQRGFCQQFATAMAVLLRSLGIPARLAVGFTRGHFVNDTYQVSTADLHTWVEVPFDGYGFMAFEPTPSFGGLNDTADSYLTRKTDAGGPTACSPGRPCPDQTNATEACKRAIAAGIGVDAACTGGGGTTPGGGRQGPHEGENVKGGTDAASPPTSPRAGPAIDWPRVVAWVAVLAASLLALGIPLWAAWRRRRAIRRAGREPRRLILAAYDVFTQRAALAGLARRVGETPQEYRARLVASGRIADDDVARLTALTVRAAYAPDDPTVEDALDASADAANAARTLRRGTSLRDRISATYRRR